MARFFRSSKTIGTEGREGAVIDLDSVKCFYTFDYDKGILFSLQGGRIGTGDDSRPLRAYWKFPDKETCLEEYHKLIESSGCITVGEQDNG